MADKTVPPPPPASLAKKEAAAGSGPLPAVQLVIVWALCTALMYGFIYTISLYDPTPCDSSCVELTEAEAAKVDALWNGMRWYAAPQAAAAALALMLPCRRRWVWIRLALACAALAAAVVSHCMYTSAVHVVVAADPGYLSFTIPCAVAIFGLAVGDLLGVLALLSLFLVGLGGEE